MGGGRSWHCEGLNIADLDGFRTCNSFLRDKLESDGRKVLINIIMYVHIPGSNFHSI